MSYTGGIVTINLSKHSLSSFASHSMNNSQKDIKRIAKNTIILYVKMVALMFISLITVRITLKALGVNDYGIINAVGGLVALSSVFTSSMSAVTGRFITYTLGEGNKDKLNRVFSSAINIHLLLIVVLAVILEVGGVWFLNTQMVIPTGRLYAANWLYQSSVAAFLLGIFRSPYTACIIAHERMSAFAYMAIVEGLFKFAMAAALYYYADDKLILYSLLTFLFACIIQYCYFMYCKRHFSECHYRLIWDSQLTRKILSFSGWNFIGASSGVLRDHGVNVLLNIFCGPAVNAARGIAVQINSVVSHFATNFTTAVNPQITKSFARGENEQALSLVFKGSRFTFCLLLLLSLPIFLEADMLLNLWLSLVPEYTVIFARLILLYNLCEAISYTMVTLMLATGRIRNYQLIVGGCQMLNLPVSYLALRWGYSPEITIVISIVVALICLFLRLIMLHRMIGFPIGEFVRSVLFRDAAVLVCSIPLPLLSFYLLESGWLRLLTSSLACAAAVCLSAYWVGCSSSEREYLSQLIKNKIKYAHK